MFIKFSSFRQAFSVLIWEQHLFKTFQKCAGNNVILLLYALLFFQKPFKIRLSKKSLYPIATRLTEANKSHYRVSLELGVNKFPPTTILSARKSGSCWAIVLVVRRTAPQNNPAAYRSERCLWHRPPRSFFLFDGGNCKHILLMHLPL